MNEGIQMLDLKGQYDKIKDEIDIRIQEVIDSARFIKGPIVAEFESDLSRYLGGTHVISCGSGTDALQIALMALDLKCGDHVIIPAFNYISTIEVIVLLGLVPILVDVDPDTYNISISEIDRSITEKTKAIVPVHLFGQAADMEEIMSLAQRHGLYVIEDNAQSFGARYTSSNGHTSKTGTIGHIGCTSFFPTKTLGCYGDGGAIYTSDENLALRIRMIANHGQRIKYHHEIVGINSRLDALQAAILTVKLKYLDHHSESRQRAATIYDKELEGIAEISLPQQVERRFHVFHQYTLRISNGLRDSLKGYLAERGIASMVYYPLPLYRQLAYTNHFPKHELPITEQLCSEVLSLPIHSELSEDTIQYICDCIRAFFRES